MGGWVELNYNVSSGPFLSFEIEIGDGPGPELDNIHAFKSCILYVKMDKLSPNPSRPLIGLP